MNKQLILTKTVTFSVDDEMPNKRLVALMKKTTEDRKKGNASFVFDTIEEELAWLHQQGI